MIPTTGPKVSSCIDEDGHRVRNGPRGRPLTKRIVKGCAGVSTFMTSIAMNDEIRTPDQTTHHKPSHLKLTMIHIHQDLRRNERRAPYAKRLSQRLLRQPATGYLHSRFRHREQLPRNKRLRARFHRIADLLLDLVGLDDVDDGSEVGLFVLWVAELVGL